MMEIYLWKEYLMQTYFCEKYILLLEDCSWKYNYCQLELFSPCEEAPIQNHGYMMCRLGKCTKLLPRNKVISRVSYPKELSFRPNNLHYLL